MCAEFAPEYGIRTYAQIGTQVWNLHLSAEFGPKFGKLSQGWAKGSSCQTMISARGLGLC